MKETYQNLLTAIIPFYNEGIEIANTIQSIRETTNDIDIVLIDDASDDAFNYQEVAYKYNCTYKKNIKRQGPACSRNIGVSITKTPYFILFDGHMRFFQKDWHIHVVNSLQNDERGIYCLNCRALDDTFSINNSGQAFGAYIQLFGNTFKKIIEPAWIHKDRFLEKHTNQIPCILGACYAMSKNYWLKIKGLDGLIMYGCEEAYLSIKTWLEGGKCILLKDILVGHIFRKNSPYNINFTEFMYNKIIISETLFPSIYDKIIKNKFLSLTPQEYKSAILRISKNKNNIKELQQYYQSITHRDFDSFVEYNKSYYEN